MVKAQQVLITARVTLLGWEMCYSLSWWSRNFSNRMFKLI